jgi:hypothetical protein
VPENNTTLRPGAEDRGKQSTANAHRPKSTRRHRTKHQPWARSFADDMHVLGKSAGSIKYGIERTSTFESLTGMKLNVKKTYIWSTSSIGRRQWGAFRWRGHRIYCQRHARVLGASLSFCRQRKKGVMGQRLDNTLGRAARVGFAPLSMRGKSDLITSSVIPKALYGAETTRLPRSRLRKIRSAIVKSLWGPTRSKRAPEAVIGLYTKSHLCDPWQASSYRRLISLRRLLTWVPEARHKFEAIWRIRFRSTDLHGQSPSTRRRINSVEGMIGLIAEDIHTFGWDWSTDPYAFTRPGMQPLPICGTSKGWWAHQVREGIRNCEFTNLRARRRTFAGLEEGLDRHTSFGLLGAKHSGPQLSQYDKGVLLAVSRSVPSRHRNP